MKNIDLFFETVIFRSRWILAPFYLVLILAIVSLLVKFLKKLGKLTLNVFSLSSDQAIVSIHFTFGVSGVLFALTDFIVAKKGPK